MFILNVELLAIARKWMIRSTQVFCLLVLLWPVQSFAAAETPEVTAYRYGALGRLNEMQGKNTEALDYFNQSLAIKPDPIIYSNRGDLKKKLGDIRGSIMDYDKAIALMPGNVVLLGNRGLLRHQLGDLDGAIADYSQVISLNPNNAIIYNNRGYAKITKGDRAGAIADYTRAVELDPKTIKFRENLANAKRNP